MAPAGRSPRLDLWQLRSSPAIGARERHGNRPDPQKIFKPAAMTMVPGRLGILSKAQVRAGTNATDYREVTTGARPGGSSKTKRRVKVQPKTNDTGAPVFMSGRTPPIAFVHHPRSTPCAGNP